MLVLTILATVVLLMHMQTVSDAAGIAAETPSAAVSGLPSELLYAGVGMLVLLVIQVLNIYKPRGMTPYGCASRKSGVRCCQRKRNRIPNKC
jgi:hypothetical protein